MESTDFLKEMAIADAYLYHGEEPTQEQIDKMLECLFDEYNL